MWSKCTVIQTTSEYINKLKYPQLTVKAQGSLVMAVMPIFPLHHPVTEISIKHCVIIISPYYPCVLIISVWKITLRFTFRQNALLASIKTIRSMSSPKRCL